PGTPAVRQVPVGGGTPTTLEVSVNPSAIALDATYIYWGDSTYDGNAPIYRKPKAGGTKTTLVSGRNQAIEGIAVDDTNVYYIESAAHEVWSVPKAGGTPMLMAAGGVLQYPRGIAVDDAFVYVADDLANRVFKISKTGTGA